MKRHGRARASRASPSTQLRAAAGAAILEGGGDIDFLIIGSTPMASPAQWCSAIRALRSRVCCKMRGDIINMELAAGYRGYTAA